MACSGSPEPQTEPVTSAASADTVSAPVAEQVVADSVAKAETPAVPASYKDIVFPEFRYVAPYPKDFRVEIAPGIAGYIVSDRSLPLVNFTVYFEQPHVPMVLKDEAASSMVGSMLRRGGGGGISARALDDSLEFISAGLSSSVGTFASSFDIDCLSKDFDNMLALAKQVLTAPAFDKEQLEILRANFLTAYDRRYDTPAKVLSELRTKVNYAPNPRLWDANADDYKKVSVADVKRLSQGVYSSNRIVFALSGDVDKDSAVVKLKEFFEGWKAALAQNATTKKQKAARPSVGEPQQFSFLRKPAPAWMHVARVLLRARFPQVQGPRLWGRTDLRDGQGHYAGEYLDEPAVREETARGLLPGGCREFHSGGRKFHEPPDEPCAQ